MIRLSVIFLILLTGFSCQNGSSSSKKENKTQIYKQEFQENQKAPEDFFVMEGIFQIRKLGPENHALYLRPIPLGTYSMLFGPEIKSGVQVEADIFSSQNGRTYPSFGVGTHGISGLQLRFSHNRKGGMLQLIYNESQIISSAECDWKNMQWSRMKLRVEKTMIKKTVKKGEATQETTEEGFTVMGKCWPKEDNEPDWQIKYSGKIKLDEGQSSILGIPYSGTDIFYDNMTIYKP